MTSDLVAILLVVGLIAGVAIWFSFRDTYVDIKRHPEEPYDGQGLKLTIPTLAGGGPKKRDDYWKARVDGHEEFWRGFDEFFSSTADFSFHAHLVGIKHANRDRTRRGPAIKRCVPLEILILEPEPDNPEDPLAVAVKRSDDRVQLGYLDWLAARDIRRDMENGGLWIGLFKRFWCAETGAVIGADIVLVRLKADVDRVPIALTVQSVEMLAPQ